MSELLIDRRGAVPMGVRRLDPGKPTITASNGNCRASGVELAPCA
jgi:enoyl-CoA hydratase/carnithine racemase